MKMPSKKKIDQMFTEIYRVVPRAKPQTLIYYGTPAGFTRFKAALVRAAKRGGKR